MVKINIVIITNLPDDQRFRSIMMIVIAINRYSKKVVFSALKTTTAIAVIIVFLCHIVGIYCIPHIIALDQDDWFPG